MNKGNFLENINLNMGVNVIQKARIKYKCIFDFKIYVKQNHLSVVITLL